MLEIMPALIIGESLDFQGVVDPQSVDEKPTDKRSREDQPMTSSSGTYIKEDPTREFLNVKKLVDDKTQVAREDRFDTPDCGIICCPKLL